MLYIEQQAIYFYSPWVDKYEEAKENQYARDSNFLNQLHFPHFTILRVGSLLPVNLFNIGNHELARSI
jgi:hypothetical protein